jgi:uncharacterized protein (DUF58 family)
MTKSQQRVFNYVIQFLESNPDMQEMIDWAATAASQAIRSARRRSDQLEMLALSAKLGIDNNPKFIV